MPDVLITEYTDPACPWAYSAEPFRRRLTWLYEDRIAWSPRMVVLYPDVEAAVDRWQTPERYAKSLERISHEHGMPIDTRPKPRLQASLPACRAFIAARIHAPDRAQQLLRCLRVWNFRGELLDEPQTIQMAAVTAELDPAQLTEWMEDPRVDTEMEADMMLAREPNRAARILDHKLANWSGGRRYTCPSYEIERLVDGVRIAVPGFQPFAVYDVILANLVPGVDRRDPPQSVKQVLRWSGTPLATHEVAVICDLTHDEARERLGRVAVEQHVGFDGFWTLTEDA